MTSDPLNHVSQDLEAKGDQKIKLAISDIDGILRGKYIHIDKFKGIASKGFGFCNVVFGWDSQDELYDNSPYTGWNSGYPDANAKLDFNTFRRIPWDQDIAFFLGDFVEKDGQTPLAVCPRQVLKKTLRTLKSMGYESLVGCEFEWFNFQESADNLHQKSFVEPKPLTPGMFGYSLLRSSASSSYFNAIIDSMNAFDVPIEGLHTETGPGVYEAAIRLADPLTSADRAILFKTGVKEIAQKHQVVASFMARWHPKLPGCSGHLHQSLTDSSGQNLFYNAKDPHGMSELFKSYLAGQIKYLPEVLAMLAPTVNSYKRLVEGYWAPTRSTWGYDNRTCAFRILGPESATRVEVRIPGSDMNPYLSIAASLAAGLKGVQENLELKQAPIQGNGYEDTIAERFPSNLLEAAQRMQESEFARQAFGSDFVEHFCATREWEWRQSQQAITDWELKRYFEII